MIAINPGNFGSLACPCAFKMAALSSHAVRNRCDGSRRDEIAAGIGGSDDDDAVASPAGSAPLADFFPFLEPDRAMVVAGPEAETSALGGGGAAEDEPAPAAAEGGGTTPIVGSSNASRAIVFSNSFRNRGCSSASGASSFCANASAVGIS